MDLLSTEISTLYSGLAELTVYAPILDSLSSQSNLQDENELTEDVSSAVAREEMKKFVCCKN